MPVFFWTCQALAPLRERPETGRPFGLSGEHANRASSARRARPSSVPAGLRPAGSGSTESNRTIRTVTLSRPPPSFANATSSYRQRLIQLLLKNGRNHVVGHHLRQPVRTQKRALAGTNVECVSLNVNAGFVSSDDIEFRAEKVIVIGRAHAAPVGHPEAFAASAGCPMSPTDSVFVAMSASLESGWRSQRGSLARWHPTTTRPA